MADEPNAAERAAKLRAAERAAAEERAQIKAEKNALRKKKAKRRRNNIANGFETLFEFIADNKFGILCCLFFAVNVTLCVLMCMGVAEISELYEYIAKICFYIGIGTCIISTIIGIVALNDDESGFACFFGIALFVVNFAMLVIGALALFIVVL